MLCRLWAWRMGGKLEEVREGVSPLGGRPKGVKEAVDVSCQRNNLLSTKLGLKSCRLSRLFPTICSGELQSCGAGRGRCGGWVPPGGTPLWGSPSSPWLLGEQRRFRGTVDCVLLEEAVRVKPTSPCEGGGGPRWGGNSLLRSKKRSLQRKKQHCEVRPPQGDSWGSSGEGQGLAPRGRPRDPVREKPRGGGDGASLCRD